MFLWWGKELLCFYNDAYRPSLGNDGKHSNAIGRPAAEIWPEIWHIIKPLIDLVLSGGEATWSEDQLIPIYRNGKIEDVYWTFSYSPVKDESGDTAGVFVTCTETTDKVLNIKRLEESKEKLQLAMNAADKFAYELERQVQERTRELEEKNGALEKMNEELKSFAYVSSHDLQEPLRKIQTFSDRILQKEERRLSENGKYYFDRIQHSARRMRGLIDDLLAYSQTNNTDRAFEVADLGQIVREVLDEIKEAVQEKGATIQVGELATLKIIPFQFHQLLHNLFSNALKFSSDLRPTVISVKSQISRGALLGNHKLSKEKDYCHITVTDNGIGFEPKYSEKIFQVFQRLHHADEYNGTGIGLAIVKKIVDNHGGVITATGELNEGARFDVYIPV
jgi:light-regulated signal transduction histidine kinase (bacteriophytochrome)